MVGRPKEFEHDVALERAMEVFWTRGYQATSVQDLLDGMKINRGSMYDTFGDKHALFLNAVEHYGQTIMQKVCCTLEAPGSPMGNLHKLIGMWSQMACGDANCGPCRGCLVCNTAVELAPHDPQVAKMIRSMLHKLEKTLQQTLQRARDCGELSTRSNPRALARFLTNTVQGLVVMGKANVGKATIKDIVEVTLAALK